MSKLRLAVVGAGRLGGFHAQKLAAMPRVELVAVVDPVAANCQRVAATCRTRAIQEPAQLRGRVDAVVIAAPTSCHRELGLHFLRQGVHVLMEKPLADSLAGADQLLQAARTSGAVLQVGHVERFNPAFQAALPYTSGPKFIEVVRSAGFTFRSMDVGVVLDLMIHDLDLVLNLVGAPLCRVEALGLSVLGGHEDVAQARLEFQGGCVATLSASRVSYEAARRMHVWTPRSFAAIDFAARKTTVVEPSAAVLARQFDARALSPAQAEHLKDDLLAEHLPRREMRFDAADALALELDDFVESIRQRRQPRVTGQQGRDALAAAEQFLQRIESHAWDDSPTGPVGPLAVPRPHVVPSPHFDPAVAGISQPRRQAG